MVAVPRQINLCGQPTRWEAANGLVAAPRCVDGGDVVAPFFADFVDDLLWTLLKASRMDLSWKQALRVRNLALSVSSSAIISSALRMEGLASK